MDEQAVTDTDSPPAPMLTALEARILGALMEKQRATPDYYPMTLNGLVQACNQKTSRVPIMNLTPGEVGHAVNQLRDRGLIRASVQGRAERYDQRLTKELELDQEEAAALCVLMLRGPQTPGEIRTNSARLAEFSDLAAVTDTLELLMAREPPLVMRLAREAGKREERFAQLVCGEPDLDEPAATAAEPSGAETAELTRLRREVDQMRSELDALWKLTGLADQRPAPTQSED